MNNVQLYSVYLQNISFIKTILRFTLACNEAVPHHPPPLLTWDREGGGTVLKEMSAFGLKNPILVTWMLRALLIKCGIWYSWETLLTEWWLQKWQFFFIHRTILKWNILQCINQILLPLLNLHICNICFIGPHIWGYMYILITSQEFRLHVHICDMYVNPRGSMRTYVCNIYVTFNIYVTCLKSTRLNENIYNIYVTFNICVTCVS